MAHWLRGKRGGLAAFVLIAALVAGGLGWATHAALRLESEQRQGRAQAELDDRIRLAMSLLDSRVAPTLSREENRPYNHYSAVYAVPGALVNKNGVWRPDTVLEASPLLGTELPDWLLLHFQIDNDGHWASPQVLGPALRQRLTAPGLDVPLDNATPQRERLLAELKQQLAPPTLLAQVRRRSEWLEQVDNTLALANPNFDPGNNLAQAAQPPAQAAVQAQVPPPQADQSVYPNANWNQNAGGYQTRNDQRFRVQQENRGPRQQIDASVFENNIMHNGSLWFAPGKGRPSGRLAAVSRRPMVPLWLPAVNGRELLVVARLVEVGDRQLVQGVVLDWTHLQKVLAAEVAELFPDARFLPMRDPEPPHPERTMTHLPVEMDPGIEAPPLADAGWTPLRIGLALAWAAALVALCAVGLGSWGLLDLSERRFRFVSAVTHELRTPLTTLRLYLDMLTGGMVREEAQRAEYLHTLRAEADRLHRLVANVLDFSRLENQRPRLVVSRVTPADLL